MEKENLIQKFKNLPQDLKDVIFDVDSPNIIRAIAKKYGLQIDQAGELADEIGLLMLGITHPRDFVASLAKRLGTDSETTKKIAEEINAQIFSKVKESLKKIHSVEDKTEIIPSAAAVPTPKTPFEQKLEEKIFKPGLPAIVKEVEQAKKENRYPDKADPYKEPPKEI